MAAGGCSGPCWQCVALWWSRLLVLDRPYMCHLHTGAQLSVWPKMHAACVSRAAGLPLQLETASASALTCSLVCQHAAQALACAIADSL